ncbi:hypothetical protein FUA23_19255 [Neolewinella aurantiaca]|uniref:Uncharacterized protein n=1 Tax=Neolewinella aurantiaca TaxID=2602767 RepID=A0A5C7FB62_9BACT|nr:hypothetical protein [Neolewinella aurantiaca]TXF86720.1 hypothetical protein FUA23_19255 [Neolewinella aurantiaca]
MFPEPQLINGEAETVAYLSSLNADVEAGNLVLLPPDNFHKETNAQWINRRYLDKRTGEIFRVKGRMGGPGNQFSLERKTFRTKTVNQDGSLAIDSTYMVRYYKPPLFGHFSVHLEMTPPKPEAVGNTLTIDFSKHPHHYSKEVNRQVVESIVISAIARVFAVRRSQFSSARVVVKDLRVHHIDTGFDVLDYVVRRCLDQAFDDGAEQPGVVINDGMTVKKISMTGSGAIDIKVINEEA